MSNLKKDIIGEFNLPSYIKGKSFAEASKAIDKKFEGREGAEAIATKKALLARLSEVQEYTKMQSEAAQPAVPNMGEQMFNSGVASQGQNQMMIGGLMSPETAKLATDEATKLNAANPADLGGIGGMAGTALELGQTAFGDNGIATDGTGGRGEAGSIGGAAAGGAVKGAAAGAALGPWGAAVGGVLGGAAGIIGGSKAKKDMLQGNLNAGLIENNQFHNDFAAGGKINPTKKSLTEKETAEINKSTGVEFTDARANSLFERTDAAQPTPLPKLDFGKYGDVNYFKASKMEGDNLVINNTENNPHNASTINQNMDYLRKLNPDQNIKLNYNQYAKGGKMSTNEYSDGGFEDKFKDVKIGNTPSLTLGNYGFTGAKNKWQMNTQGTTMEGENKLVNAPTFNTDVLGKNTAPYSDAETGNLQNGDNFKKEGHDWGQTVAQAGRLAPIVGNALQLGNMKNSDPVKLDRLDSRYKENRVDERALENRVQNEANNTTRALAGASNGSMGALRSNLLGNQLNKTNALSDSYLKATDINRNESKAAQQFNNGNETINLRQGTVEQQMNDQNEGALNSAKSALQSQLANDIGSFGKEKVNMKQVAEMFGYTWDGKYMRDKSGKIVKPEDIETTNSGKDKKQDESK